MNGDQSLFTRSDAIERLWERSAPLLDAPPPVQPYDPGSWGPQPALDRLAAPLPLAPARRRHTITRCRAAGPGRPPEATAMIKPDLSTERLGGAQAQPKLQHHGTHPRG